MSECRGPGSLEGETKRSRGSCGECLPPGAVTTPTPQHNTPKGHTPFPPAARWLTSMEVNADSQGGPRHWNQGI